MFVSKNVNYYGIEGSEHQCKILKERFKDHPNVNIINGDFTKSIDVDVPIHLSLDRSALTHNCSIDIKNTIDTIYQKLALGGVMLAIDWFAKDHYVFQSHEGVKKTIDESTFVYESGYFENLGSVHFFDVEEIKKLFSNFEIILLEEKRSRNLLDNSKTWVSYNVVAKKVK